MFVLEPIRWRTSCSRQFSFLIDEFHSIGIAGREFVRIARRLYITGEQCLSLREREQRDSRHANNDERTLNGSDFANRSVLLPLSDAPLPF